MTDLTVTIPELVLPVLSILVYRLLPGTYRTLPIILVFILGVLAHHGVSLTNLLTGLPGTEGDSYYFHLNAFYAVDDGRYPIISIGTGVYEWLLVAVYSVLGPTKLNGQSLSILCGAVSIVMTMQMAHCLEVNNVRAMLLLICLMLTPTHLFFTSITFREPFQLIGLTGGFLFFMLATMNRNWWYCVPGVLMFLFMGLFHHVLLALAAALSTIGLIIVFFNTVASRKVSVSISLLTLVAMTFAGYFLVTMIPASPGNDYIEMLLASENISHFIFRYREAVDSANPRTTYGFMVETFDWRAALAGLSRSYLYYIGGPWPHELDKAIDYVPFVNSIARTTLIIACVYLVFRGHGNKSVVSLLLLFFLVTLMWSIGSTNYGQAFRHNVQTDWILFLVFAVCFPRVSSKW